MSRLRVFTQRGCGYSSHATQLLVSKGIPFEEVDITANERLRGEMIEASGEATTPQILIDGRPFGGADALDRLERDGVLDGLKG